MRGRDDYLNLLHKAPYEIGHMLGFSDLTPLNNEWIRSFVFSKTDQTLQAHRGSYKTTCLSLAIVLIMILYPKQTIIFTRKTDTDVNEIVKQVANALKSDHIRRIVQVLYGTDLALTKETASELDTNLNVSLKGQSQLLGLGIKTSVTGKHADIIITDDIVNIRDRVSRAERDLIKTLYQEFINVKNRGGRFINTGTPWHKDDAFSIMPAITKYDCYSTGLIDKQELDEIRQSMSPSLFAANYELKHIADGDALFTAPRFVQVKKGVTQEAVVKLLHGGVGHIDARYTGNDYTAMTFAKKHKDVIVMFGKRWDKHVDDCLEEIEALHTYYQIGTLHMEDNADKGYLKKEISKRGIPTKGYHESTNKYIKISTHLRKHWPQIRWLDDTDPEYLAEILDYTEHSEHDDSPDSAASLIRWLENKPKVKTYEGII